MTHEDQAKGTHGTDIVADYFGPALTGLQLHELGEHDVRHGADLVEHRLGHRVVQVEDGDGPPAPALAAELHARDVDVMAAAHGADPAPDARDVQVGGDEHPAVPDRLPRVAGDPHDPGLPVVEERAGDAPLA